MSENYVPEAGDIVWTDFDPRTGREQSGRRPALIVSPKPLFAGSGFLIVCPITSKIRPFGSSVVLPANFPVKGEILTAQVRSIDAFSRPIRYSGASVDNSVLSEVRGKLGFLCGILPTDLAAS